MNLANAIPSVANPPTRPDVDSAKFLWNIWWFRFSIDRSMDIFHCPMLFFPQGATLYFDTLTPLSGMLAYPLSVCFSVVVASNGCS